MDIDFVNIFWY